MQLYLYRLYVEVYVMIDNEQKKHTPLRTPHVTILRLSCARAINTVNRHKLLLNVGGNSKWKIGAKYERQT